jgi:prevent-host-death family protein
VRLAAQTLQSGPDREIDLTNVGHMGYTRVAMIVNIAEAKARLSQLALRASRGEEIILSRHGQPIARIVPLEDVVPAAPHRGFGIGRGDFTVPPGFDDPLPDDILDLFEADDVLPR